MLNYYNIYHYYLLCSSKFRFGFLTDMQKLGVATLGPRNYNVRKLEREN